MLLGQIWGILKAVVWPCVWAASQNCRARATNMMFLRWYFTSSSKWCCLEGQATRWRGQFDAHRWGQIFGQLDGVCNVEYSESEQWFMHAVDEQTYNSYFCCCSWYVCLQMMVRGSFSLGVGNGGNVGAHGGDKNDNSCLNLKKYLSKNDEYT